MINQDVTSNWTYEHFIAYICLSIAGSDYSIDAEELTEINAKINRTANDNSKTTQIVKEVSTEISNHSDQEKTDFIEANTSKFLPTPELKAQARQDMEDVIVSDDNVDSTEMVMFRFIKKALA